MDCPHAGRNEHAVRDQAAREADRPIEPCRDILVRTAGKRPITDDNMGTEWREPLGLE